MNLIAYWTLPHDEYHDAPSFVRWADGTPATMADYDRHRLDTRKLIDRGSEGQELYIWPGVVAEVYWCPWGRTWGVRGQGVEATGLNLTNEYATDGEILAQISQLEISYRYTVTR